MGDVENGFIKNEKTRDYGVMDVGSLLMKSGMDEVVDHEHFISAFIGDIIINEKVKRDERDVKK